MVRTGRFLLLLAVVVAAVYGGALDAPFQYDDHHSLANNPAAADARNIGAFFTDPGLFSESRARAMYRPLVLLSYALTQAPSGGGARAHHAVNLVLHGLAGWALFLLARSFWGARTAGVVAVLFLVHPLASEPALYISARSESLALALALLSVLAWRRDRAAVAAGLFAAALLAKSTAIVTPAILWSLDRALPRTGEGGKGGARRWLPVGLVAAVYLIGTAGLIGRSIGSGRIRSPSEQVLAVLESWPYQARLLLVPHPLSVEHPLPASLVPGFVDAVVLAGVASLACVLFVGVPRRAAWLALVAAIPLVPPSLVPLNAVVSEHRLYWSVALACLGTGAGLRRLVDRPRPRALWILASVGVLALLSRQRVADWGTELSLWQAAVRVAPGNARAHFFLGDVLRRQGQDLAALRALARADSLSHGATEIRAHRAALLLDMGRVEEARVLLEPLARSAPDDPAVCYNLALAVKGAQPGRADSLLARAQALRPGWRDAAMERALLQDAGGDPAAARRTLEQVLETSPTWVEGWVNVGFFRVRSGDLAGARQAWERALALDPAATMARDNLRRLDGLGPQGPPASR